MPYTVEICFDKKSDKKIRELWNIIARKNISNFMLVNNMTPHITLTVFNDIEHKLVNDKLKKFTKEIKPFKIVFSHIGSFPSNNGQGVVFLSPTVTIELLRFHKKFHKYFTDYQDGQEEYYLPDKWVPHCTLALNISQDKVNKTMSKIMSNFKPIEAKVKTINFVKYQPAKIISQFILD